MQLLDFDDLPVSLEPIRASDLGALVVLASLANFNRLTSRLTLLAHLPFIHFTTFMAQTTTTDSSIVRVFCQLEYRPDLVLPPFIATSAGKKTVSVLSSLHFQVFGPKGLEQATNKRPTSSSDRFVSDTLPGRPFKTRS